jgi:hypothetical protein
MTKEDLKDLKRALFETEMRIQGKGDIPYLEYGDILDIVVERQNTPNSKINLSQEAFEFYSKDFQKVQSYLADMEATALKEKKDAFDIQVEKNRNDAIAYAVLQDKSLPWQLRKGETAIRTELNKRIGTPSFEGGHENYMKKIAEFIGGDIDEQGRIITPNERQFMERFKNKFIQEATEEKWANNKAGGKGGMMPATEGEGKGE